jgi:hypothetical protein
MGARGAAQGRRKRAATGGIPASRPRGLPQRLARGPQNGQALKPRKPPVGQDRQRVQAPPGRAAARVDARRRRLGPDISLQKHRAARVLPRALNLGGLRPRGAAAYRSPPVRSVLPRASLGVSCWAARSRDRPIRCLGSGFPVSQTFLMSRGRSRGLENRWPSSRASSKRHVRRLSRSGRLSGRRRRPMAGWEILEGLSEVDLTPISTRRGRRWLCMYGLRHLRRS